MFDEVGYSLSYKYSAASSQSTVRSLHKLHALTGEDNKTGNNTNPGTKLDCEVCRLKT